MTTVTRTLASAMTNVTALIDSAMADADSSSHSTLTSEEQTQIRTVVDRYMHELAPNDRIAFLAGLRSVVHDERHRRDGGMTSVLGGAAQAFLDVSSLSSRGSRAARLTPQESGEILRAALEVGLANDQEVANQGMSQTTRDSLRDTFIRVLSQLPEDQRAGFVALARQRINDMGLDEYDGQVSPWATNAVNVVENAFQTVMSSTR